MGGFDRNTIVLWLITALIGVGGGSLGTTFIEPPDRYYGSEGRAVESSLAELRAAHLALAEKVNELVSEQKITAYRVEGCLKDLAQNEDEHRNLELLVVKVQRLEWAIQELKKTHDEASSAGDKTSKTFPFLEGSPSQSIDPAQETTLVRVYPSGKPAIIKSTF